MRRIFQTIFFGTASMLAAAAALAQGTPPPAPPPVVPAVQPEQPVSYAKSAPARKGRNGGADARERKGESAPSNQVTVTIGAS